MTRARVIANLGTQAGSGLDASDITTGALGAGVTFPAGHIIQVLQSVKADKINTTSNSATGLASTSPLTAAVENALASP